MKKSNNSLGSLTRLDKKYLYIQTFGCQMNVHDSEQIVTLMEQEGYVCTEDVNQADLIILNTCSIREKAAQKVNSQLGRFRSLKTNNDKLIIGVGGCVAQQMGKKLFKKVPELDLVFGTHNIHQLPELISEIKKTGKKSVETTIHPSTPSIGISTLPRDGKVSAFVTIMQGCNNFCSYCIVPYLRGREESRAKDDIIKEIRNLADHGIKEVTLLGQNVNSYARAGGGERGFVELLQEIEQIEDRGKKLYASIQIVSEAADVLIEYAKSSTDKINTGIDDINNVIDQLTLFIESTTNILAFVKPFN